MLVDRDGTPTIAVVAALTADGSRALANSRDPDVMEAMTQDPWEGKQVVVETDGTTNSIRV